MNYTIIDSNELAEYIEEARIQLQLKYRDNDHLMDISSMQENCAFLLSISAYLAIHHHHVSNRALLIDELSRFIRSEISADHQFSEADYKTILGILLPNY